MKLKLLILLLSSCAAVAAPTIGGPTISPTGGSTVSSNTIYDIALIAAESVGGATNGITQATASAMMADGTNSFAGDGNGLTNLNALTATIASLQSTHISAFYVTNAVQNRASIYVTGSGSAAVNGQYNVQFYYPSLFLGVWTNTASTNMIIMNNVSNSANYVQQPFVLAGTVDSASFMYSEDQSLLGVRDTWANPFTSEGAEFTGTASLSWATNEIREMVLVNYVIGNTNTGIVATNLMRVSTLGSDEKATRYNGYPFKTIFAASTNASNNDLIFVEPGYHKTRPLHMTNRNFHILGAGEVVCTVEIENFQDGPEPFQSRALVPWDNCSIGNFTITNGLIAFAQFSSPLGGTNAWVHDLTIYPPRQLKYPDNTDLAGSNGDQSQYFNVGVDSSRIGNDNRIERVKVLSGMRGFSFVATTVNSGTITMIDCEAYCAPEYSGSPNIWTNAAFLGVTTATNVGGMLPIALAGYSQAAHGAYPFTLNIIGGYFSSLNGGTNRANYIGGETNTSRNTSLWIARTYTNTVNINLSGVPIFENGNTNTFSYAVLNEATNNNVTFGGYYSSNYVAQTTNAANIRAVGTNSTAVTPNISLYLTNSDGVIYRLSAEKL